MTGLRAAGTDRSTPWWIAFLAALVVLAFKAPDALVNPQFWAEDSVIFFLQQRLTPEPLWFSPYAGYLLFIPRLVAWLASGLPAWTTPCAYSIATLLIGAAALTSLRDVARISAIPFIVLLAVIALIPVNAEVFGNLTNVQWLTQFYLLAVILRSREGTPSSLPALTVPCVLAVSLTGPFAVLLTAATLVTVALTWRSRDRDSSGAPGGLSWLVTPELLALFLGAGLQAAAMLSDTRVLHKGVPGIQTVIDILQGLQHHLFAALWLPAPLFALLVLALPVCAIVLARRPERRFFATLACAIVVIEIAAVAVKFAQGSGALAVIDNGDRYFLLPKVAAWWLLASLMIAILPARRRIALTLTMTALCLSAVFASEWIVRPAMDDLDWRSHAAHIDAGEAVVVPVHPRPWRMNVPARQLDP